MADAHANFAYSTVLTAPSPATSGTSLVVASGDGAKFPAVPFNATVWPVGAQPITTNAEIVRVTARSTDTLTITRTQESTTARTIVVGDQIAATVTKQTLTDLEALIAFHGVKAKKTTTTQTIPTSTLTPLNWDGVDWDTDTFWAAGSPSRLTIPAGLDGKYLLTAHASVDDNGSFGNNLSFAKNGVEIQSTRLFLVSNNVFLSTSSELALVAGDYVQAWFYQNSGGTKTPTIASCEFAMHKLVADTVPTPQRSGFLLMGA